MSKIIKSSDLVIAEPFIVVPGPEKEKKEKGKVPALELQEEVKPLPNLEMVKKEADLILKETEEMVKEILAKAGQEAKSIIEEAREEAEVIRKNSLAEAEALKNKAREEGYREGWEKARVEAEADLAKAREESERIIKEALEERRNIINSCEEMMVRLCLATAAKIAEKEIEQNPDIIIRLIRKAIEALGDIEKARVYLNPKDMEMVVEKSEELERGLKAEIEYKMDEEISRGGCVVESEAGSVDATLENRIKNLKEVLLDVQT